MRPDRRERSPMEEAALSVAVEGAPQRGRGGLPVPPVRPRCPEEPAGSLPRVPRGGRDLSRVEPDSLEAAAQEQGGSQTEATFDGGSLRWARAALEQLGASGRVPAEPGPASHREGGPPGGCARHNSGVRPSPSARGNDHRH
jgi:hypothetical protein